MSSYKKTEFYSRIKEEASLQERYTLHVTRMIKGQIHEEELSFTSLVEFKIHLQHCREDKSVTQYHGRITIMEYFIGGVK